MKILFATGGTGGHIYPALRLADELKKRNPDCEMLFVGNSERIEAQIIPQAGYAFHGITAAAFNNVNLAGKLNRLKILKKSYQTCLGIVDEFKPDLAIGFGGYVTVPVILAAHHRHIATIIHEQNSYVGMANRFLGHYADAIITCYESAVSSFPKRKVHQLGNPRASIALDQTKKDYLSTLQLDSNLPTVLIVMGSLGSSSVNQKLKDVLKLLADKPFNVLYVTGPKGYQDFVNNLGPVSKNIKVVDYIDQASVARQCALVVSRGGATSACEYQSLGLPVIIIPSPYVPNNHQFHNAMAMVNKGAAQIIEEKDLTAEKLATSVCDLMADSDARLKMSQAALSMAHPKAAEDIAVLVEKMAGNVHE